MKCYVLFSVDYDDYEAEAVYLTPQAAQMAVEGKWRAYPDQGEWYTTGYAIHEAEFVAT